MTRPDALNAIGDRAVAEELMPRASRVARFGRWFAAKGWVHVLVMTLAAAFLYPFAWMLFTSMKTDEELTSPRLLPEIPHFVPASPYVREAPSLARPEGASEDGWKTLAESIRRETEAAVLAAIPAGVAVDPAAWAHAAAAVVAVRETARMPKQAWQGSADEAMAQYRALVTPVAITDALADRLAALEIQTLQLRTLDARIFPLVGGADIATKITVESGSATLVPTADGTRIDYRFASGSDAPVVLAYRFTLPDGVQPGDLHKLIVSLKPDDSWHRVAATLDLDRGRWVSDRSTSLAQNRATSIVFQPPSFDDDTYKARTWVRLSLERPLASNEMFENDITPEHDRSVLLRLTISPSSTVRAMWGKATRNYQRAFDSVPFWTYVGNSLLLVALTTMGALFSSAFVAYAFARLRWPGRGVALIVLLSTMMLPGQVTMIPSFLIWRELGWYNTLNPLWVGAWFGNAFFIFLMIQHMRTIPKELEEAARIDGLKVVQTWWYIIVPQVRPILAAIAIMSFLGAWNEFMGPLIYLRDQSKFPLSLGLFGVNLESGSDFSMVMAGDMLMTLPAIIVFFCFQRYFIQGMTVSGMKG